MPADSTPRTVSESLFDPLIESLLQCDRTWLCPALPDLDWVRLCLGRVLQESRSGRGFLQEYGARWSKCPERGAFFESLKSRRRLGLLEQLNAKVIERLAHHLPDQRLADPRLQDFDLYAGDGHWHGAAAHDPAVEGTKYAVGHFYGLNLRSHGVVHLTVADQGARLHEHDMRALKRLEIQRLRQGALKKRKVIWVWDKAGIDFQQWHRWKQAAGIYFISRTKENMKLEVCGLCAWDPKDPVNAGVLADDYVATSQGVAVRRVTYRDPVSGTTFEFLTTEMTLPPGWIVHLYRMRWEIEKVFDGFKNKLGEKKARATSATAKSLQAQFLCLAHNLLLLFERTVLQRAGVTNQAEDCRRATRLRKVQDQLAVQGQSLPPLVQSLQRCTQRSVKLLRWLRSHLASSTSCGQALHSLRTLYATL